MPKRSKAPPTVAALDDDLLINPDDFKSIETSMSITNESTKTALTDGKRVQKKGRTKVTGIRAEVDPTLQLVEFDEHTLTIDVPGKIGAKGHRLKVEIEVSNLPKKLDIEVTMGVHSVEKQPDGRDRMVLQLLEEESLPWKQFREAFEKRQEEILEFLEAARG